MQAPGFGRARILRQLDKYEQAVMAYEEALRYQPKHPNILLRKADALACLGKNDEALAAYEEVLRLRPGDQDASIGKSKTRAKRRWVSDKT